LIRRGLTLIELMVALIMTAFVVLAATSAYSTGMKFEERSRASQELHENRLRLEERLRQLIQGIYVSSVETDATTYLLAEQTGTGSDATTADSLTFTTISDAVNATQLGLDTDFETLNRSMGTQGGVAEVAISLTPVGEQGQNLQGLFLRVQRPADGDPTQGGYESLLDDDVNSINFEFWDGEAWDPTWGTSGLSGLTGSAAEVSGQNGRRIPAAIRVTYTRTSDPNGNPVSFVVRLPQSDVTSQNPSIPGATTPDEGATP
jgi:prepilin-type N-terminal cleavage/methylation domain-containing protein